MVELRWKQKSNLKREIKDLKEKKFKFETIDVDNQKDNQLELRKEKPWANKLFWGDNLKVAVSLLSQFEGKLDLIYIDPPFFSGSNYHIQVLEDDNIFETVAYHDNWGDNLDTYLDMLYKRIYLFKKLLSPKGLIFIHLDWHASHYIRIILDEIFGIDNFINSIVWYYYNKYSAGKNSLPRAHDTIFVYSKADSYTFNQLRIPRQKPIKQLKRVMVNGTLKNAKDQNGNVIYRIVSDKKLDDVWKIPCMQPASKQWTGYPTQKHHKLLERIIKIGSNEGDLIADFYCGSGTTIYAAEKLKRRWIGVDNSKYAIYLTSRRILELHKTIMESYINPFEVLTIKSEDKKKIINSNFFKKNLTIKRKK